MCTLAVSNILKPFHGLYWVKVTRAMINLLSRRLLREIHMYT